MTETLTEFLMKQAIKTADEHMGVGLRDIARRAVADAGRLHLGNTENTP
jgi:hypothetical protein